MPEPQYLFKNIMTFPILVQIFLSSIFFTKKFGAEKQEPPMFSLLTCMTARCWAFPVPHSPTGTLVTLAAAQMEFHLVKVGSSAPAVRLISLTVHMMPLCRLNVDSMVSLTEIATWLELNVLNFESL